MGNYYKNLFNKNLELGPRPKYKDIQYRKINADVIISLLKDEEADPDSLIDFEVENGYIAVRLPRDARPWADTQSCVDEWVGAARVLNAYLEAGNKVYLHCAAGIHRTGIAAYTYYRKYKGVSHNDAIKLLEMHRPVIARDLGNKIEVMRVAFRNGEA